MRAIFVLALAVGIAGCASRPPLQTASGQPEITLSKVDIGCIRSHFLNAFVDKHLTIKSATDMQIIAEGDSQNTAANLLLSTRASGFPKDRITALFIPLPQDGVRIVVSEAFVSNAGTAFEQQTPIGQSQQSQDQFLALVPQAQLICAKN